MTEYAARGDDVSAIVGPVMTSRARMPFFDLDSIALPAARGNPLPPGGAALSPSGALICQRPSPLALRRRSACLRPRAVRESPAVNLTVCTSPMAAASAIVAYRTRVGASIVTACSGMADRPAYPHTVRAQHK
jgi:hypothetical protein